MNKKYFNDAFIGNKNITASFSKYGELLRLYYPAPDYRQYSDFFHVGLKVNDSNIIYLHKDVNNTYKQYYTENTNILNTEIDNSYFNLHIKQIDCVMIKRDVLIKKYIFTNNNSIDLNTNFIVHSKVISSYNNMAGGLLANDALVQYSHNFTCAILSKEPLLSHQLNDVERNILSGEVFDKDYIGMAPDAAISFDLGTIKPGESKEFTLVMYMTYDKTEINKIKEDVTELRRINTDKEIEKIEEYWKKFVEKHDKYKILSRRKYSPKFKEIYKRTILFMDLLINHETGGVAASLEVDEERDKCGRYSYCWPRDAVMIYNYLDYIGFNDDARKFYEVFLKKTQNTDGMWEQRFYTDGRLAPCWGYQIDETASVIWGAYNHYLHSNKIKGKKDISFLKRNLPMFEKAMDFLEKYIRYVLGIKEEKDLVRIELEKDYDYEHRDEIYKHPTFDLWEMNEGVHLYSLSTIFGAFDSMIKIYKEILTTLDKAKGRLKKDEIKEKQEKYEDYMRDIKRYIMDNLYDKQRKVLVRNTNDRATDISIMGAVYPFKVFEPGEKVIRNTVEQINMTLRTYQGGYLRFENDTYIGGIHPWIISTAWMGKYYQMTNNQKSAAECLNFIVNSAADTGLLSEQANSDLNEKWVIGLGWSHAMFISMLLKDF